MHLSKSETDVLETLWSAEEPLSLVALAEATPDRKWKTRSAFPVINKLLDKGLIREAGFVHSGKTIARTFVPSMTRAEYYTSLFVEQGSWPELSTFFAAMLDRQDVTPQTLRELERMLKAKKAELAEK